MKQHENIKNQKSNIKNTVKRSRVFELIFVVLVSVFLFLNLIYSQFISSLYQKFVNNDKISTVSFLQKIKDFPEFQKILEMSKNIYGETVREEVFRQENDKNFLIKDLEHKLKINPKARDILYSLYQLYLEEGDNNRADDYLRQVKAIDPSL